MDTLTVAKFAQHRVNWITVCQCYLDHTRANVCTSCEWPITAATTSDLVETASTLLSRKEGKNHTERSSFR